MARVRSCGWSGDPNKHDRIRGTPGLVADTNLGLAGHDRNGECDEERCSNDGQNDERRATTEDT